MFARLKVGLRLATIVALTATLSAATAPEAPVADAAQRGDLDAVRSLLRQGADANAAQPDGMTGLHWAALADRVEIAQVLLYAGATPKATTRLGGYTPLHLAARSGHAAVLRALLEGGADPDVMTDTGVTAAHFAAQADAADVISALMEHGATVDVRDAFAERTPLMFAAASNAVQAVEALLAAGADPTVVTAVKDYVAVSEAHAEDRQRRNRIKMAELDPDERPQGRGYPVPPRPGQPGQQQGQTGQQQAQPGQQQAQAGQQAERRQAQPVNLQAPAEPAEKPEEPPVEALSSIEQIGTQGGFSALHFAVRDGHAEAARALLDGGAELNQVTEGDRSSPLLVAIINGNYDIAMELLERGADPNLVSDDGAGPLFATLNIEWSLRTWYPQPGAFRLQETSYLDLMKKLLEAGADPNQRTTTHIWYASYNAGRMGVDFTGATPFWRAAYAHDVQAMRLLAENGADPDIWTTKLPDRRRFFDPDDDDQEDEADPSGLPPVPIGGPAVHPLHAAAGVGFGTSRVAQQHRGVPDGWLPAIKYLVEELGVDPTLRDKDGFSAIHHAAARGDNETILYLVSKGVPVTTVSRRGQTTADMANSPEQRAQPHPVTVALLEKLGSRNNHQCRSCGEG